MKKTIIENIMIDAPTPLMNQPIFSNCRSLMYY